MEASKNTAAEKKIRAYGYTGSSLSYLLSAGYSNFFGHRFLGFGKMQAKHAIRHPGFDLVKVYGV